MLLPAARRRRTAVALTSGAVCFISPTGRVWSGGAGKKAFALRNLGSRRRLDRPGLAVIAALAAFSALCAAPEAASAFDFFGLFGSDAPPPVSKMAISYQVTIDVAGGDGAIKGAVTDSSSLVKLRKDPPPDGRFAGAARVQRFRPDHRRALGPRLLRCDRHDLDRRRGD